jgi:hypothetical protein
VLQVRHQHADRVSQLPSLTMQHHLHKRGSSSNSSSSSSSRGSCSGEVGWFMLVDHQHAIVHCMCQHTHHLLVASCSWSMRSAHAPGLQQRWLLLADHVAVAARCQPSNVRRACISALSTLH